MTEDKEARALKDLRDRVEGLQMRFGKLEVDGAVDYVCRRDMRIMVELAREALTARDRAAAEGGAPYAWVYERPGSDVHFNLEQNDEQFPSESGWNERALFLHPPAPTPSPTATGDELRARGEDPLWALPAAFWDALNDPRSSIPEDRERAIHAAQDIFEDEMAKRAATALDARGAEEAIRALLVEARDKGLIYWEPNTTRGHIAKADMLARIDRALGSASSPAKS